MEKKFNITGTCFSERHYMADVSAKFKTAFRLVMNGEYFAINRPRQYGKTTMLEALSRELSKSDEWLVFNISFEGIGSEAFNEAGPFCRAFVRLLLEQTVEHEEQALTAFLQSEEPTLRSIEDLSAIISELAVNADRKLVLLIDEVDKSSNNQLLDIMHNLSY